MPKSLLPVVGVLTLAIACGGKSDTTPTTPTSTTGTTSGTVTSACTARASSQTGGSTDPSGPFGHQTAIATTDTGTSIRDAQIVLDHASVPDGTRLPDGGVGFYYVNGSENAVWFARLSGGVATPVGPISISGITRPQGVVDPDATLLSNERIRLVYLSGFASQTATQARAFCVAESFDGLAFQVVGTAIDLGASTMDTDPSVTQLRDGSWLMASSRRQTTVLSRSSDGVTFTLGETLTYGGVPEVTTLDDGRVRLYVCAGGIESYVSADSGRTWQREGIVAPSGTLGHAIVCDPSKVAGTNLFIFKTAS